MRLTVVNALVGLGSTAFAASSISSKCFGSICYKMNIPQTSSSGSGDVYYQISGPTSNAWIAMGTGSTMVGSSMFVIYTSSSGSNVTLSPRKSIGEIAPTYDSSVQASLLDGSGVENGVMTANIKCSNCDPTTSSFIYAYYTGDALNSDDQSANLQQHGMNDKGTLDLSVSAATGGSDSNPFVSDSSSGSASGSTSTAAGSAATGTTPSSPSNTGSACTTAAASRATNTSGGGPFGGAFPSGSFGPFSGSLFRRASNDDECVTSGNGNSNGSNGPLGSTGSKVPLSRLDMKRMAHGICAGLAFAVGYPIGAIVLRLFNFPGLIWVHAGIQIVTNVLFIVGFALGVSLANEIGLPLSEYHPVIGIVLLCLVIIQPILGHMHHLMYKQVGTRTYWSYGHLFVGRLLITLGIINGGLGFYLANNTKMGQTVYAIVAAIVYAVYLLSIIIGERRRAKSLATPPKYHDSPESTSPRAEYFGHDGNAFQRDIQMERFPPPASNGHRGDGYTRQQRWSRIET